MPQGDRYVHRVLDLELDTLLHGLPAIAIDGAKGVGKTSTARRRAGTIRYLDDLATRELAAADPRLLLDGTPPVLLDEWQLHPGLWDLVRRAVDDSPTPGRFLLTGSATPTAEPTHSGAGRIVRVLMRPLSLAERGFIPSVSLAGLLDGTAGAVSGETAATLSTYVEEIVKGGFAGMRALPQQAHRRALRGYLDTIVERDFPEAGHVVRRPATLRAWMSAYAAATSTTASYDNIRDAATAGDGSKPAKTTTIPYRDVLERLWVIEPVPAWQPSRNHLKRLAGAPKHQLVDPALAAQLLGVGRAALLGGGEAPRDGAHLGALFESLVTQSVRVYAQAAEATVAHFRTRGGEREVDLVVVRDDGRVLALEVKLAQSVTDRDVRHLVWLRGQLGEDLVDAAIITTGPVAYRRTDGVAVIPAALLGP